jgi:hypothetical protein
MSTVGREDTVERSGRTPIMHESQKLSMKEVVENMKEFNVEAAVG